LYEYLFDKFPETIELGADTPTAPPIFRAIPNYGREDLASAYLSKQRLVIFINTEYSDDPYEMYSDNCDSLPFYDDWTHSGICERIEHIDKLHLV